MAEYSLTLRNYESAIVFFGDKEGELPRRDDWISDYHMGAFIVTRVTHIWTKTGVQKIDVEAYDVCHSRFYKGIGEYAR